MDLGVRGVYWRWTPVQGSSRHGQRKRVNLDEAWPSFSQPDKGLRATYPTLRSPIQLKWWGLYFSAFLIPMRAGGGLLIIALAAGQARSFREFWVLGLLVCHMRAHITQTEKHRTSRGRWHWILKEFAKREGKGHSKLKAKIWQRKEKSRNLDEGKKGQEANERSSYTTTTPLHKLPFVTIILAR